MNARLQRDAGTHQSNASKIVPLPATVMRRPDHAPAPVADAYEAAFLRGGENAVLVLNIFDLVQRGYLEFLETRRWLSSEQRLSAAPDHPTYDVLTQTEQDLVGRFTIPRRASETFGFSLPEAMQSACSDYAARFEKAGLLRTQAWAKEATQVIRTMLGIAWFVGFFVLAAAKAPWPVFAAFFAALAAANFFLPSSRLTANGKAHLKELEAQFDHLKDRPKSARLGAADPALLTAVGVFGVSILAGSAYDAFAGAVGPMAGNGWSLGFDAGGDGCGGDGCGGCGCGCGA